MQEIKMRDLISLFKPHIENLFDSEAKFVSNNISKIRVDQPNRVSRKGFKDCRSIVLAFDEDVIKSFSQAEEQNLNKTIASYKFSLRRQVVNRMNDYDPDGDRNTAFLIHIDSRATDL